MTINLEREWQEEDEDDKFGEDEMNDDFAEWSEELDDMGIDPDEYEE